jgi:hypothetical protein
LQRAPRGRALPGVGETVAGWKLPGAGTAGTSSSGADAVGRPAGGEYSRPGRRPRLGDRRAAAPRGKQAGGSSRQAGGRRLLAAPRGKQAGGRSSRLLGRLLEAGTHGLDGGRGRQRPGRAAGAAGSGWGGRRPGAAGAGGRGGRRQGSGGAKVIAGARASDCLREDIL